LNGTHITSITTSRQETRSFWRTLLAGLTAGVLLGGLLVGGLLYTFSLFTLTQAALFYGSSLFLSFLLSIVILFYVLSRWRRELLHQWIAQLERWQEANIQQVNQHVSRYLDSLEQRYLQRMDESMTQVSQQVAELRLKETLGITWLETLYHAFTLLSEAEDEASLYENIVTAFAMLDGYTQVFLLLGRDELGPLRLVAALGLPQDVFTTWLHQPWRPPLWGVVVPALAKRKPFWVQEDPEDSRSFKEEFPWPIIGDRALALPLLGLQSVQGVVLLVRQGEMPVPTQLHLRLLEIIALFAGRTLEDIQLAKGVQAHITELLTIQSITKTLISAPSVEALVRTLSVEITSILGPCHLALILLEDMGGRRVYLAPHVNREEALFVDWRVVQWVSEASQPVFYTPGQVGEDVGDLMFESAGPAMAIPLEGPERPLGVLVVASQIPGQVFEEPHMVGVRTIANTAVVGLYALRYRRLLSRAS